MKKLNIILQIAAIALIVYIVGPTVIGKFSGDAMAVGTFEKLGVEPFGRYITAVLEAFMLIGLISWKCRKKAAILGNVIFTGAAISHIFVLGTGGIMPALIVLGSTMFIYLQVSWKECC